MKITFRLDDQGHVVAEGCDRGSPLAKLLEEDIGSDIGGIHELLETVSNLRPVLSTDYVVPKPVDIPYAHTHLRLVNGVATVRFTSTADGSGYHAVADWLRTRQMEGAERVDTIDLRTFEDVLRTLRRFRLAEQIKNKCLSQPLITLYIREEYGFAHWVATLTAEEYRNLIRRWETIRGLSSAVPVDVIVPQAKPVRLKELDETTVDATCHIHQCGDSYLDGSTYTVSEALDGQFWMDGEQHNWGLGWCDLPSVCPDILLSRAVTVAEVEAVLSEIVPGLTVLRGSDKKERLLDVVAAAVLIEEETEEEEEEEQQWPVRLRFPVLPSDSQVGLHPHVVIAKQLADRLAVKTLIEG